MALGQRGSVQDADLERVLDIIWSTLLAFPKSKACHEILAGIKIQMNK